MTLEDLIAIGILASVILGIVLWARHDLVRVDKGQYSSRYRKDSDRD